MSVNSALFCACEVFSLACCLAQPLIAHKGYSILTVRLCPVGRRLKKRTKHSSVVWRIWGKGSPTSCFESGGEECCPVIYVWITETVYVMVEIHQQSRTSCNKSNGTYMYSRTLCHVSSSLKFQIRFISLIGWFHAEIKDCLHVVPSLWFVLVPLQISFDQINMVVIINAAENMWMEQNTEREKLLHLLRQHREVLATFGPERRKNPSEILMLCLRCVTVRTN